MSTHEKTVDQDWDAVYGYLTQAVADTALETGGPKLLARIQQAEADDDMKTGVAGLLALEAVEPGIGQRVVRERMAELQRIDHELELAGANSGLGKLKKIGSGMLRLFG